MHDLFAQTGAAINPVPAATVAEALQMLSKGQHDYAVLATLPARHTISDLGIADVEIAARSIDTKKILLCGQGRQSCRHGPVCRGMATLKRTGKYRELQDKWLPTSETHPWVARHGWIIVAVLFLGLAASMLWSRSLKQQVSARTAALEREVERRKRAAEELSLNQQQLVQADKMAALGILVSGYGA